MAIDENTIVQYSNTTILRNTVANNTELLEGKSNGDKQIVEVNPEFIAYESEDGERMEVSYEEISIGASNRDQEYLDWVEFISNVVEP